VKKLWLLILLVILLTVLPLAINRGSEFAGADGLAEETIMEVSPDYEPWAAPFWEPPGGETESLLFALQAALGAGFLGYYAGWKRGQVKSKTKMSE
jgi:cobalt/nickel transport protein